MCTPAIILGAILSAALVADVLKRDARNALITFFFAIITVGMTYFACTSAGEVAGWMAMTAVIGFLILVQLARNGSFDGKKAPKCDEPPSGPDCPPIDPCNEPKC
jgi:hypothetical protein